LSFKELVGSGTEEMD